MGAVQREITVYVYQNCWWLIIEMGYIFSISKFSDLLIIDYNVLNLQINQISVLISQFDLLYVIKCKLHRWAWIFPYNTV